MDTLKLRELLDRRDALDVEITDIVNGNTLKNKDRKPQACGNCGEIGHSARTCTREKVNGTTQT